MSSKVLIIDDDDVVHFMHETLLKMSGIQTPTKAFLNGRLALDFMLSNSAPDDEYLLLLDINMPVMNGWELLDELEKNPLNERIRTIILTSSVDSEDHLKAKRYPKVIDFIEKPLTSDYLKQLKAGNKLSGIFN